MKFKIFFVRKGRNNGSSFESIVRFNILNNFIQSIIIINLIIKGYAWT